MLLTETPTQVDAIELAHTTESSLRSSHIEKDIRRLTITSSEHFQLRDLVPPYCKNINTDTWKGLFSRFEIACNFSQPHHPPHPCIKVEQLAHKGSSAQINLQQTPYSFGLSSPSPEGWSLPNPESTTLAALIIIPLDNFADAVINGFRVVTQSSQTTEETLAIPSHKLPGLESQPTKLITIPLSDSSLLTESATDLLNSGKLFEDNNFFCLQIHQP